MTKFIGDSTCFFDVVNHMRGDEHHQLIAVHGIARVREQMAKIGNVLQKRNTGLALGYLIAEKTAQRNGFAVGDGDGTGNLPLLDCRRIDALTRGRQGLGNFLIDVHHHLTALVDSRGDLQDDARGQILHAVHLRRVGIDRAG